MTIDLATICPFCDQHHECTTLAQGDLDFPDDGDVTLCFGCGRLCVFDSNARGGLRKPTKTEQRRFDRDHSVEKLIGAWKIARRQ